MESRQKGAPQNTTRDPLAPLAHVRRDLVALVVLVVASLAVALPRHRVGIGLRDEGLLAHGAVRVLSGDVPHLDFVSLQPPLAHYLLAAVFALFSPSLAALRSFGLVLHLAFAIVTYALARRVASPCGGLAAALPAMVLGIPLHNFVPFSVWLGALGALAAAALLLYATATGRSVFTAAAGVATTWTFAARQDQGVYLVLAVLAYVAALAIAGRRAPLRLSGARLLGLWLVGFASTSVPLLALWWAWGALPDMISQLVVFPLTRYPQTSSLPMPALRAGDPFSVQLLTGLFYLPPLVVAGAAATLVAVHRRRPFTRGTADSIFVLVLALLFYGQVLVRSDLYHLVITLAPSFVLIGIGLDRAAHRLASGHSRAAPLAHAAVFGFALALAMVCFGATGAHFLKPVPDDLRPVRLARAGVALPDREARAFEQAVAFLQENTDREESILVLPYQPMYYFLAERRNPTRWNYLWPGDQSAADHAALLDQARADPPAAAVVTRVERLARYAPTLVEYVNEEFEPVAQVRDTIFYLRPDAGHEHSQSSSSQPVPSRTDPTKRPSLP